MCIYKINFLNLISACLNSDCYSYKCVAVRKELFSSSSIVYTWPGVLPASFLFYGSILSFPSHPCNAQCTCYTVPNGAVHAAVYYLLYVYIDDHTPPSALPAFASPHAHVLGSMRSARLRSVGVGASRGLV